MSHLGLDDPGDLSPEIIEKTIKSTFSNSYKKHLDSLIKNNDASKTCLTYNVQTCIILMFFPMYHEYINKCISKSTFPED